MKAFWTLLGPGVEPRKTSFDADAAIRAFEAVGREDVLAYAENFSAAPTRQQASEYFESLVTS